MNNGINILLADDHKLFCQSFQALLRQISFVQHVYIAHNGAEAIDLIRKHHIDVALLDVRMPVMDGLEAAGFILQNHPKIKVISMTNYAEDATILDMLRVGAHGILLKEISYNNAVETAITEVMNGRNYYSEEVKRMINVYIKSLNESSRTRFTPREFDVLRLTCKGETAKEIAKALNLTHGSVENHRKELLRKSKTRNVAELVSFAIRNGIV
ncbi:MAG: response regulator transcription factor [Cyclobacteriaceae bacterium]|nr:response regulator transcription factor [Cyclobacteriaceae bacterium]